MPDNKIAYITPGTHCSVPGSANAVIVPGNYDTVYVSGIAPVNEHGVVHGVGAPLLQVRQIIKNLEMILATDTLTLEDVIKLNVYVNKEIDMDEGGGILPALLKHFPQQPAVTFLYVFGFLNNEALLAIDAVAAIERR